MRGGPIRGCGDDVEKIWSGRIHLRRGLCRRICDDGFRLCGRGRRDRGGDRGGGRSGGIRLSAWRLELLWVGPVPSSLGGEAEEVSKEVDT